MIFVATFAAIGLRSPVEARRGRLEDPLVSFERARTLAPRQWRHHLEVARALERLGRRAAARTALTCGLEVHPTNDTMRVLNDAWAGG